MSFSSFCDFAVAGVVYEPDEAQPFRYRWRIYGPSQSGGAYVRNLGPPAGLPRRSRRAWGAIAAVTASETFSAAASAEQRVRGAGDGGVRRHHVYLSTDGRKQNVDVKGVMGTPSKQASAMQASIESKELLNSGATCATVSTH